METPLSDPTTTKLRRGESTASTPLASTPTSISLQLDAETDADLYGQDSDREPRPNVPAATVIAEKSPLQSPSSGGGIPGLFLVSGGLQAGEETEGMVIDNEASDSVKEEKVDEVAEKPAEGAKLTAQDSTFASQTQALQTMSIDNEPESKPELKLEPTSVSPPSESVPDSATQQPSFPTKPDTDTTMGEDPTPKIKAEPLDPDFLAAGEASKDDANAEWQLDSTSDESTSDISSSDEADSDDDDYPLMDHEQLAKLLMCEDGGDEDDGRKEGFQGPLKTKNEIPEEAVPIPRPDVVITPEMKVELLGAIETIVGTMVLIKAFVSGDHQVLNEGSLLCFEDRSIVGVVADTFGRVEEPLYTVRFNTAEEIAETKATVGMKVYYVPKHSEYVFTQALKGIKGSDASNIFDEEVGDAEREFSDDEAEAEYKRLRKSARQAQTQASGGGGARGRGKGGAGAVGRGPVGGGDELYTPLARPANLAELMNTPPPLPPMNGVGHRGERRGGRNDRGGRGRGRGGQRGGRGGGGGGGGHEFRKRDRDGDHGGREYQDRDDQGPPSYHQGPQTYPQQQPQSYPQQGNYQQPQYPPQQQQFPQQQQQFSQQPYQPYPQQQQQQWAPPPSFSQFPYPQQQQQQQQQPYQQQPHSQPYPNQSAPQFPPALPQGSHVNPAFFRGQQHQQSFPAPPARNDFSWTPPMPQQPPQGQQDTQAAFKALQNLVSMSNQMRAAGAAPGGAPPPPPAPPQ